MREKRKKQKNYKRDNNCLDEKSCKKLQTSGREKRYLPEEKTKQKWSKIVITPTFGFFTKKKEKLQIYLKFNMVVQIYVNINKHCRKMK